MVCAERSWVGGTVVGVVGLLPDDFDEAKRVNAARLRRIEAQQSSLAPSGQLLARAWDSLVSRFGSDIVPEIESLTIRDLMELYLE